MTDSKRVYPQKPRTSFQLTAEYMAKITSLAAAKSKRLGFDVNPTDCLRMLIDEATEKATRSSES